MPDGYEHSYSATGNMFGELADGIFGRLREKRDEQQKRDDDTRRGALQTLASMLDKVSPDSQPMLLQQMGQIMDLKGPHRGLWDKLTGRGMDSTQRALGSKLNEIMSNMIGPAQKETAMRKAVNELPADAWDPGGVSPYNLRERAGLNSKMVLRDPQQEKLDAIEQRYSLQNEWNREKLYEADYLKRQAMTEAENQRQQGRMALASYNHRLKSAADVDKVAEEMSKLPANRGKSWDDLKGEAADYLDTIRGLKVGQMRETLGLTGDKRKLTQAMTQNGGLTPAQAAAITDRRLDDVRTAFTKWKTSGETANKAGEDYRSLNQQINDWAKSRGLTYDTRGGILGGDQMKAFAERLQFEQANPGIFKREQAARDAEQKALSELQAAWDTLGTENFKKYVRRGKNYWEATLDQNAIDAYEKGGGAGVTPPGGAPSRAQMMRGGTPPAIYMGADGRPTTTAPTGLEGTYKSFPGNAEYKADPSLIGRQITTKDGRTVTVTAVTLPHAPDYPYGLIHYK